MTKNFILLWLPMVLLSSCLIPKRSGPALYNAMFGKPADPCTEIFESRDAAAIDDQMLYIHFKTCPQEIKYILSRVPYSHKNVSRQDMEISYTDPKPGWFDIRKLGDSCTRYFYKWEDKDYAQVLYLSNDSSEVFYREDSW